MTATDRNGDLFGRLITEEKVNDMYEVAAEDAFNKNITARPYRLLPVGSFLLCVETPHRIFVHESEMKSEPRLGQDSAIISYSAATTGRPKGAVLTHFNLIEAARNLAQLEALDKKEDYFSFLPLSWVHEQEMSIVIPLVVGFAVNFPEKPHTVIVDLREIGPHTMLASPRVYQSLMSSFTVRIEGASWFKRKVYNFFKKYGDKNAIADANNQPCTQASGADNVVTLAYCNK